MMCDFLEQVRVNIVQNSTGASPELAHVKTKKKVFVRVENVPSINDLS